MLNNLTWQGYWATLALLAAAYYLVIYLLYFRKDVALVFPAKKNRPVFPSASPAVTTFLKEQVPPSNELDAMVNSCVTEIAAYFEQSKKEKLDTGTVLTAMHAILSKYPQLKGSDFQQPILQLIVSEANHLRGLHLSEEEVFHGW